MNRYLSFARVSKSPVGYILFDGPTAKIHALF